MFKDLVREVNILNYNCKSSLKAYQERRVNHQEVLNMLVEDIDRFKNGLLNTINKHNINVNFK